MPLFAFRRRNAGIALTAVTAALALMVPSANAASTFSVNVQSASGDFNLSDNLCDTDSGTPGPQCGLTAALQQANSTVGADRIAFDRTASGLGDEPTLTVFGSLPPITEELAVNGGNCGDSTTPEPCVGIDGSSGGIAFDADASNVAISGLAIGGFESQDGAAIRLTTGNTGLTVRNTWLGRTLAGTALPNGTGVVLQGSSSTVGGAVPAARNVISSNEVAGVRVFKGDSNKVIGNYFGTDETGNPGSTSNAEAIEVVADLTGSPAGTPEGTQIGQEVTAGQAASGVCDGACNLIVNSTGVGIDLNGEPFESETPASATSIRGNYVGLSLGGTFANANGFGGIRAGSATGIVIGGPEAGERNFISGNSSPGITSDTGLTVENNFIGTNKAGTAAIANASAGAGLTGNEDHPIVFRDNLVGGDASGLGLSLSGTDASVTGNTFGVGVGGQSMPLSPNAIHIVGSENQIGVANGGNVIGNSGGTAAIAIPGGDGNSLLGNMIGTDSEGADHGNIGDGILLTNGADENTIGGQTAASANVISNNTGDAISIPGGGADPSGNVIARNLGADNGDDSNDMFIDLGLNGIANASSVHGGIEAPVITAATADAVGGTAQPNAVVRIFRKASDSLGELDTYVGRATADGSGAWLLPCPSALCVSAPVPGQRITASQTGAAGSSELSTPAIANEGGFEVDSSADGSDQSTADGECFTFEGVCTLRAAVEQANTVAGMQTITFDPAEIGGTTVVKSGLTPITIDAPAKIIGCAAPGTNPCINLESGAGVIDGVIVSAPNVTVSGLAFTRFNTALRADTESDGLRVQRTWFGLALDGTGGLAARNLFGLELRGDDAVIGGAPAASRNVFGTNDFGIVVKGGDNALIQGNRIGTLPDGLTAAPLAASGVGIQVRRATGDQALDTSIGGTVSPAAAATPVCDGVCNLIATSTGVLLGGGDAAHSSGPSQVRGNFIGLNRTGTESFGTTSSGIIVGAARNVEVGGPSVADRNFIGGAITEPISAFDGVEARNNFIGLTSDGLEALGQGITSLQGDPADPVIVADNRIAGEGGAGLRLSGSGGEVTGNRIGVAVDGARLPFTSSAIELTGSGYTISGGNVIAGGTATDLDISGFGDPVRGDNNVVTRNFIGTDATGSDLGGATTGIDVSNGAEGNVIGGTALAQENVIAGSLGAAISVRTSGATTNGNQLLRNRGTSGGRFIRLTGGTNDAIVAPQAGTVTTTSLIGSGARPNAAVRVYTTLGTGDSSIRRFVGQGVANGAGVFTVNFPNALAAGACVVANQTDQAGNSSELSNELVVGGGGVCDTTGPTVSFVSGPTTGQPTTDTTPLFVFEADEPGSTFECQMDGGAFEKCKGAPGRHTPATPLALGNHLLRVRATDPNGNTGPSRSRNFAIVAP